MTVRLCWLLVLLLAMAGCAGGGRSGDSDSTRPVFYGGISGGPLSR